MTRDPYRKANTRRGRNHALEAAEARLAEVQAEVDRLRALLADELAAAKAAQALTGANIHPA